MEPEVGQRFRQRWTGFLIFLIDIGFDALVGITVFTVFLVFAWILSRARALGWGTEDHFKAYELAHFWLNFAVFVGSGFAGVLRIFQLLFRH